MDRLDKSYRQALGRLRTQTSTNAQIAFKSTVDEKDILATFEQAIPEIAATISDAQLTARETAQAYVTARVDQLTPDDDPPWEPTPIDEERVGQSKEGKPLEEALRPIGYAILGRIADNGGAPPDPGAQSARGRANEADPLPVNSLNRQRLDDSLSDP